MVQEYLIEKCRYLAGSLKPFIYVLPKETTRIDYLIDNYKCEVKQVYFSKCLKIEGFRAMLNVTESVDNRLDFSTRVTLSMREQWGEPWCVLLNQLKMINAYIVVEDYNGVQYIQSPEFISEFSYTYNFDTATNNAHVAELSFQCDSNNPVIILNNRITETDLYSNDCAYSDGGVRNFRMCPYQYAFIDNSVDTGRFTTITVTGGETMHLVEFTPHSFQFRQQFDGRNYQERLTFRIPLSDYKYYFRYNLVEFKENRYAVTFETSQGNFIAAGFEFGFMPTYTIETSETVEELNLIEITLQHVGQNSIFYCSDREPSIIDSETNVYVPVTQQIKDPATGLMLSNYRCTSKTEAIYTLIQMVTESGVPTDRYMCLQGYESYYSHLNITGTYSADAQFGFSLTFSNYDCAITDNCNFIKMTKEIYSFSNIGDFYDVHILNNCPWTLYDIPSWIDASITSGEGGTDYVVRFTCKQDSTDERVISYGYLRSAENVSTIQFILEKKVDWINPVEHNITAQNQTVTSYVNLSYPDYEICEVPQGITAEKIRGTSTVRITVPENTSESEHRTFIVTVCNVINGERGYIYVNQDRLYVRWAEAYGEYVCTDGDSYRKVVKYKGYTADSINIQTDEYTSGAKLIDDDARCSFDGGDGDSYAYQWRDADGTICIGTDLYSKQRKWESFDGGSSWHSTDEYRNKPQEDGGLIEEDSSQCQDLPEKKYKYIVDESMYGCLGTSSHYMECYCWSYDNIEWYKVEPSQCRVSETAVRKDNDPVCGGGGTVPGFNEKWERSTETYCKEGFLFYLERKYVSTDGGITWSGTDEYREGSTGTGTPCTDGSKGYEWRIDYGLYVCDGTDSYYAERYYYYYTANPGVYILSEPVQTRKSTTLRKSNDVACGYTDPNIYRWNTETGYTVCQGTDKYTREDYEYSSDGGETWLPTGTYRAGTLVEEDSQDCSGTKYYRWEIDNTRWICSGTTSYYIEVRYESTDGIVYVKSVPEVTQRTNTKRLDDDPECGGGGTVYRWIDKEGEYLCEYPDENPMIRTRWVAMPKSEWICRGYDLYMTEKEQMTEDGGQNWYDTGETRQTTLGDDYSNECAQKTDRYYINGAVGIRWDSSGDRTTTAQGIYLDYVIDYLVDSSLPAAMNTRLRVVTSSPQESYWYRVVPAEHTVEGRNYRSFMVEILDNSYEGTIDFYWQVYDSESGSVLHTTRRWTITRNALT